MKPLHEMTEHEIVDDMFSGLFAPGTGNAELIRSRPRESLFKLHHSVGHFIRNRYGLWERPIQHRTEGERVSSVSPLVVLPVADAIVDLESDEPLELPEYLRQAPHPDDVSMRIIETLWERLQK